VDTNVRRVLARVLGGRALPPPHLSRAEVAQARSVLPEVDAATWSAAVMELGAVVCTARSPRCTECPVAPACRWRLSGHPPYQGPPRRGQAWTGTDRQCRGVLLHAVREAPRSGVPAEQLRGRWSDAEQAARCLTSLLRDGLLEVGDDGRVRLPS
jgi:A/G-specific adenine glycosylase